jgi:predicted AAA+ superfamily ATPase
MKERTPYINIWQDIAIDKSMIFLVGPRQAGKTTLSLHFIKNKSNYSATDSPQYDHPELRGRHR